MKRFLILTTALLLVLALGVNAQEATAAKKMHFGITGGLSMGNLSGSDADPGVGESKKMRVGFAGGVFADFGLGTTFALQPQLLYVQKGVKYEATGATEKNKFDYLEVPVLLKWVPQMQGKMQPTIFVGPYLGFLMSAKSDTVDVKDSLKTTDFGITFGAGFGSKMTSGELFFDVRLDLGLTEIDDSAVPSNVKNTAFMAMVGYKFGN
ncbi:MAG: PorT family protein [candidate division Zixibacteria bacterium]|nr:PorT family protein [candidate division Zixibacteria bacterium]